MNKFHISISFALVTVFASGCTSLDNGLALTPPMGWMSWLRHGCLTDCDRYPDECISEKLFKKVADLIVSEGYKDVGYEYVIIDDCWLENERSEDGKLQADQKRFPKGIKHLADYIHSKGLKFGIYEDYGSSTCQGYPGILDHMKEDADLFAEWGVDYVKLDGCYSDEWQMDEGYPEFGRFLNATGRPMVYSCSWPAYQESLGMKVNYSSLVKHCNLWRNYGDIQDTYYTLKDIMNHFALRQDSWQPYAGPGHWNDPDMLLIGNYGLSIDQAKAQMAVWAILAAPLLMSTDLRNVRPEFKKILQNKKIIAVNQDKLGIQGRLIFRNESVDVWVKPIEPIVEGHHSYAIAYVSQREDSIPYIFNTTLSRMGLLSKSGYRISELFATGAEANKSFILQSTDALVAKVNPNGAVMFKAKALRRHEL